MESINFREPEGLATLTSTTECLKRVTQQGRLVHKSGERLFALEREYEALHVNH